MDRKTLKYNYKHNLNFITSSLSKVECQLTIGNPPREVAQ